MGLLEGGKAIVTGGGSGIGRATCRRMAEEGATVAVLDLDGDAAAAVADEIGGVGFTVDVGDPDRLRQVVDDAVAELGGLSILYNNAGTSAFHAIEFNGRLVLRGLLYARGHQFQSRDFSD